MLAFFVGRNGISDKLSIGLHREERMIEENMFSYNNNARDKKLFVTISKEIKYNFTFLNAITDLMKTVESSNCERVYVSGSVKYTNFNKMGMAYLYNTLSFLTKKKTVFVDSDLLKLMHERVTHSEGEKFKKIDLHKDLIKNVQQCYRFKGDKSVNQTVEILVDFIANKNLVLENAKEFLVTTIGEIFSNAFIHSDENSVFFMYDIEFHDENFFLVINITDYGKTIIGNVQEFHNKVYGNKLSAKECMAWAMGNGHTTRAGSGGYGLPTLVDYVSKADGELLIFSETCMYALKGIKENILEAKGNFVGTSVSMKIPLFDTSKAIMYDEKRREIVSIDLDKI